MNLLLNLIVCTGGRKYIFGHFVTLAWIHCLSSAHILFNYFITNLLIDSYRLKTCEIPNKVKLVLTISGNTYWPAVWYVCREIGKDWKWLVCSEPRCDPSIFRKLCSGWSCDRRTRRQRSAACIPAPDEPTLVRSTHADTGSHVQANKEDRPTSRPWGGAPRTQPQLILRHWLSRDRWTSNWMTDEENEASSTRRQGGKERNIRTPCRRMNSPCIRRTTGRA